MRAIILAAGMGTRLSPLTNDRPKAMVIYKGRSIIERQIKVMNLLGIDDIIIVGGHFIETLRELECKIIPNNDYFRTNMVYSLFCAKEYFNDDIIVSYGDILYEPNVLKKLILEKSDISVAIDMNWKEYWRSRFDDPLKDAETLSLNNAGKILGIGNKPTSYSEIDGQFMGLLKFSKAGVKKIMNLTLGKLAPKISETLSINGKAFEDAYMTDLVNALITNGSFVKAVPIYEDWIEIDTREDFSNQNNFLRCTRIDKKIMFD